MLSFRVLMHLSASFFLISLVSGKKYLVETEDFDPQSRNRFVGFGQGGSNQGAPISPGGGQEARIQGCVDRDGQEVEEGKWIRVDLCNFCICLHGRRQGDMMFDDVENAKQIFLNFYHLHFII